eukprot:g7605.t1
MSTFTRWVGSTIPTPGKEDRGPSPVGRQRHYEAVELGDTSEQVIVNDVIEVKDEVKVETDEVTAHAVAARHHPRLAQVLSMWEDTFTGVSKCHVRWLVHSSDLPEDAFSRLQAARRAFADEDKEEEEEADQDSGKDKGKHPAVKGELQSPSQASASNDKKRDGGNGKNKDNDDDNEVFLTGKTEDLDVRLIVKPVTLSVAKAAKAPALPLPTSLKGKLGPRFSHAFDAATGDFIPVEPTDAVIKRQRARQEEAVARASRLAEESAAATSRKRPLSRNNGCLMPKRRSGAAAESSGGTAAASVRDSDDSEVDSSEAEADEPEEEPAKSDDMEWDIERDNDDSDSTDMDLQQLSELPPRKSARRRKPLVFDDESVKDSGSPAPSPPEPHVVDGAITPPPLAPIKQEQSLRKRPRRLAMPPAEGEPGPPPADAEDSSAPLLDTDGRSVRTRKASADARERTPPYPALASRRLSIAGKRKRGRPTKAAAAAAAASAGEVEEADFPPRRTPVGDAHQVAIPDLLSYAARKDGALPPPKGAGDKNVAKMVWRSIRDWDPQSRGMLSTYLHAAKDVVQAKQARPGVAVHVRLGGDDTEKDGGDKQRGSGNGRTGVASSYAVWAVTAGRNACGVVRVACSERAQTEVPVSAIQRVQSKEEALAALVKARCTLDDFEPALKILADDEASPESIDTWTLQQVRTLEQSLEKEFDRDRRLHGWAREGMDMDRDDFIDLALVSKQVPGKTPAQVLSFYYRYLAAAQPLTDVVYGAEAAEARKQEPIVPPTKAAASSKFRPVARNTRVTASPTVSPAKNNGSAVTCEDPPATSNSNTHSPSGSTSKNGGPADRNNGDPARHQLPPSASGAAADVDPSAFRRASAGDISAHRSPPASGYGEGGGIYERRRASREHNPPADVEVLEVEDSDDVAERADPAWRPRYAVPGPHASRARYSVPPEGHALGAGGPARGVSWGARQMHPQHAPAADPDRRRYLSRPAPATAAAPPLTAPSDSTSPAYGYRTAMAVPRPGVHPQQQQQQQQQQQHQQQQQQPYPARHPPAQFRREVDDRQMAEAGRNRDHDRDRAPRVTGGNSGGGYAGYEGRSAVSKSEEAMDQDTFGFMAPCWRLLERAKAYMDEDQLLYMRGLILKHVQKPMTRDQLLERAESCLQEQEKIFEAFVKMFDRIDSVYPDEPLVPLYPGTKRAAPDTRPEPAPMPMSYAGSAPPTAAAIHGHGHGHGHPDPRGQQRSPSYARGPLPRAYPVPPHDTAATAAVVSGERGGGPMRVPSSEPYSRAVGAGRAVDAPRGYQRPMMQPHPGLWESSTVTAGGGVVRSRRLPPGPGGPGPSPGRGSYPATGPPSPPAMMYRESGRERGYEVGGGGGGGAWPSHQQQQQQPRRWRADGGIPSPSAEAPPPESRRRVSDWGEGRGGGWS